MAVTFEKCRNGHDRRLGNSYYDSRGKIRCRVCVRESVRRRRLRVADDPIVKRDGDLRLRYGISSADWDRMFEEQDGKCGICGIESCPTGRRFAVDHNHETGKVRGLLCSRCNYLVGQIENSHLNYESALRWIEG